MVNVIVKLLSWEFKTHKDKTKRQSNESHLIIVKDKRAHERDGVRAH